MKYEGDKPIRRCKTLKNVRNFTGTKTLEAKRAAAPGVAGMVEFNNNAKMVSTECQKFFSTNEQHP